jgi:hypothetical protein
MDSKSKNRLADLVQGANALTIQNLTCPSCAGSLSIQYTARGKGALSVMCTHCMWRVVRDGIATEPGWVQDLGSKFQTANKLVAPQAHEQG